MGDLGSISALGRSPGEGNGYLLQYSGLENTTEAIVHGVTKSQTRLSYFHFHFHRIPKWERKMDDAMRELASELATTMDCLMILHTA